MLFEVLRGGGGVFELGGGCVRCQGQGEQIQDKL